MIRSDDDTITQAMRVPAALESLATTRRMQRRRDVLACWAWLLAYGAACGVAGYMLAHV